MNYIHAIILGIVEGITEFLPVSSTGHLILVARVLGLQSTEFVKTFEIAIQLGAILAVVVMYWKKVVSNWALVGRVLAAFVPTAVIGLVFYRAVKDYLLGSEMVVVWALGVGGVLLIIFEGWYGRKQKDVMLSSSKHDLELKKDDTLRQSFDGAQDDIAQGDKELIDGSIDQITYKQSIIIGLFQALAIVPGVSRAAATIVGGLLLGIERKAIVEFSFLLAVPTMAAATGLDVIKNLDMFTASNIGVLAVGFVVSFVSAWAAVRWLLRFISQHTFVGFGVYRVVIVLLFGLIYFV